MVISKDNNGRGMLLAIISAGNDIIRVSDWQPVSTDTSDIRKKILTRIHGAADGYIP
jgi:hypothetical protein